MIEKSFGKGGRLKLRPMLRVDATMPEIFINILLKSFVTCESHGDDCERDSKGAEFTSLFNCCSSD